MRKATLTVMFLSAGPAAWSTVGFAADIQDGRAKAEAVCSACHGANGVSVADNIPHLAGQREAYLRTQLQAFRAGERKSSMMNPIAAQLSDEEIAGLAVHFAAQPATGTGARSALVPALAATRAALPEAYPRGFTNYHTIYKPEVVIVFYANDRALAAARAEKALPDGSVIVAENYSVKTGVSNKPAPDKLLSYAVMAREAGWGRDVPEMLRNGDWNYALFSPTRQLRAGRNYAECFACHRPLDKSSFVFTLGPLSKAGG